MAKKLKSQEKRLLIKYGNKTLLDDNALDVKLNKYRNTIRCHSDIYTQRNLCFIPGETTWLTLEAHIVELPKERRKTAMTCPGEEKHGTR
jgi:hypothetical protein